MLRKATEADPLNARTWSFLGWGLVFQRKLVAARGALNRSLQISPEQSYTPSMLGITFLLDGHPAEALKISQTSTHEVFRLHGAALAEYDLGHRQESERRLARLIAQYAFGAAYQVAEVYAWRGEKDRAFARLQRARAQHDPAMLSLKVDPLLGKLNGDPRYAAMLRSVNL